MIGVIYKGVPVFLGEVRLCKVAGPSSFWRLWPYPMMALDVPFLKFYLCEPSLRLEPLLGLPPLRSLGLFSISSICSLFVSFLAFYTFPFKGENSPLYIYGGLPSTDIPFYFNTNKFAIYFD